MISRRFALFVVAGGIAAIANFISRIVFDLALPYVAAIVLAYGVGMTTAFLLNRAFVFTGAVNPVRQQAYWFVVVNCAAVLQTVAISLLLRDALFPWLGMDYRPETIAHAVGIVVPVFTSYVGHKHLSFRHRSR